MDTKQFLTEFRHIASAPEGVKRLREMILSLAFQGSLAERDVVDASELLLSLEEQRANSPEEARKSRKRSSVANNSGKPPFAIPEHWRWLSLSEVGHGWGQKTPRTAFTYIDVSSIDNQRGRIREPLTVLSAGQAPGRARKIVRKGTVIYSTVRPYLLNVALIDREFVHEPIASTAFAVVHPWEGILSKYIFYYLRCPYFIAHVQSLQIGVAYPAISDEKFFAGLIPIPPTSEQERIVSKVDELMDLCDKLEAQQQERETLCKLTRAAAFDTLTNTNDSSALRDGWNRVKDSLMLVEGEEGIAEFNRAIIDLGIRGILTRANASTNDLEKRAKFRIDDLVKRKLLTKRIWVSDQDVPHRFEVPTNYPKIYLGNIAELITDGEHATPKRIPNGPVPLVTAKNVRDGFFDLQDTDFVAKETALKAWERCKPRHNDILMVCVGATTGRLLVAKEPVDMVLVRSVALIRMFNDLLLPEFVAYCLQSSWGQRQVWGNVKQAAQPCLYLNRIARIQITAPPFEEQQRIVEVLDRLLAKCEKLRGLSETASTTAKSFATAAIASITGVHIGIEEKMKTPKTELVSNLSLGLSPTNGAHAPLTAILIRNQGELSAKTLWNSSGMEIDAFYQQLKTEMAKGWIVQPEVAYVKEVEAS